MLSIFYYVLSLIMVILLVWTVYQIQKKRGLKPTTAIQYLMLILVIWFSYLFNLSLSGFLTELQLPPRLPLFIFLPFAIFSIIFYRRAVKSTWIKHIPLHWLAFPQAFRILVEILLLYTFYAQIIPKEATFEGLNFDVLMGISAPFVGYYLLKNPNPSMKFATFWNILGILMILFVAFIIGSSFYNPQIWGHDTMMVSTDFVKFPYLLVAGFLAPLGIFMHIISLAKIKSLQSKH